MDRYKILYVEDNPTDYEMVKAILEEGDVLESIRRVEKRDEFIRSLREDDFDLILTDYSLPVFHGLEAIRLAVELSPSRPIIMITGTLPDEVAVDVIRKGAWDYVLKENIYRLIPSINAAMERLQMQKDKAAAIEALREREENYRVLSESSPYGIIVHTDGKIIYHNKQAIRIFREKEETSFIGINLTDYVHPQYLELIRHRMKELYSGKSDSRPVELKFLNSAREELILEVASSPIQFDGMPSAQVIFRDIAERKKMETDLIRAKEKAEESDRLKTAFLENLSHEIRTPLNGILGFTSLLKTREISEDDKHSYIEIVEESGKHLLNIIDDLIDISRIETNTVELHPEQFNLNHLMDELFVFFNESIRYKDSPVILGLAKACEDDHSFVMADKARLRQILYNLLSNAHKFTTIGRIDFGYESSGNKNLLFYVKDTGIGIPEESHELVFERFRQADETTTRKYEGNGLGLTISRGLVEAMRGRIWMKSRLHQGTEFFFEIPVRTFSMVSQKKARPAGDANKPFMWKGKKILVAEDDTSNFQLIRHIVEKTGATIVHVTNGKDVLKKLEKNPGEFDLLLLDIKMSEMDGITTVQYIRQKNISIPVIAQTAYAMSDDREKCLRAGCDEYITKPIVPKVLLETVNRFIPINE